MAHEVMRLHPCTQIRGEAVTGSMRPQAEQISLEQIDLDCFAKEAHLAPLPLCFGFLQIGALARHKLGALCIAVTLFRRKQASIANFGICHLQGGRGYQSRFKRLSVSHDPM